MKSMGATFVGCGDFLVHLGIYMQSRVVRWGDAAFCTHRWYLGEQAART